MAQLRTLAVWCPDWPITAAGFAPEIPTVVLHANRVYACSAGARAEGIKRNMRKREAQSRYPDVEVVAYDIDRDARMFAPIVHAVSQFTPRVEIVRPGLCVIATRGPARYFGGDAQLAGMVQQAVCEVLAPLHAFCQVGIADGPFAAQLAARQSLLVPKGEVSEFLAPFSVDILEDDAFTDILKRLGLRTLADFAGLPRAEVLARFGNAGAYAHALASGEDETMFMGVAPEIDYSQQLELDPPADRIDALAFAARQLAEQLHSQLIADGLACTQLIIEAETEHGESISRVWRHDGMLHAAAIADRARWQLDGWLNADEKLRPTSGVVLLRLQPERVVGATGKQVALWGGEQESDVRAARAFVRLQALFGHESVSTALLHGARGARDRVQYVAWGDVVDEPTRADQPWPGHVPYVEPTQVYNDMIPAEVCNDAEQHVVVSARALLNTEPHKIRIHGSWHRVKSWAGPWPTDEHWWDSNSHRRRARMQIVTDNNEAWLLTCERSRWYIEAAY